MLKEFVTSIVLRVGRVFDCWGGFFGLVDKQ
jgi:hypothetical protein